MLVVDILRASTRRFAVRKLRRTDSSVEEKSTGSTFNISTEAVEDFIAVSLQKVVTFRISRLEVDWREGRRRDGSNVPRLSTAKFS